MDEVTRMFQSIRPSLSWVALRPWLAVGVLFLLGLMLRVMAMDLPLRRSPVHATRWQPAGCVACLENDEKIFIALTEQLAAGKGYTLQGHPILQEPWISREQYDRPLFIHPPGGVALFWWSHEIAGDAGYALAQVSSFALFYWSSVLLGWLLLQPFDRIAVPTLALLAAVTPIMAHVAGRFWLDGPLLGFSSAAAALFLLGALRGKLLLVCLAGALLGVASLIKLTAFLVIPGVAALAWAIAKREQHRGLIRRGLLCVAIAGLIQLPWELWQWQAVGSAWAGKPAGQLVRTNPYIHFVTVIRPPWVYLELLPQVLWTLVPSLVLWAMQWRSREIRRRGAALVCWIAVVCAAHVALGALGYGKLLRYVILVTPATIVLFALGVGGAVQAIREGKWLPGGKALTIAILLLAAIGLGLEVTQGLRTSLLDNQRLDLIHPLPVLRALSAPPWIAW